MDDYRVCRRPMGRNTYYQDYYRVDSDGTWHLVTIGSIARLGEMKPSTLQLLIRKAFESVDERTLALGITDMLSAGAAAARRRRWKKARDASGRPIAKTPREAVLKGHETRRRRARAAQLAERAARALDSPPDT